MNNPSGHVSEKVYSWIADIPDKWGRARQDVMHGLDEVLNIPGQWGKHKISGAEGCEDPREPIHTNRFINLETKHHFLDHYARWPAAVASAYGKSPFFYHDHDGTEKAVGLDHFILILKLRYSQSLCIFALYERLANEGLIDLTRIKRVFDLGSGGWSYAYVMPIAFSNFQTAVGVDKGGEWEPFEKLWRPVFDLDEEQFVLCDKNFFELEKSSPEEFLEDNFDKHGKADLAQIFMFKPEGIDQSYHKLFYQIGERLEPAGVLVVHVKGEDRYVLGNMRKCLGDIEHMEFLDWHTDVKSSGVIGPDEVRIFVIKKPELMKLKEIMERDAERMVDASKSPWDAINSYDHLLALDEDNPTYLLQQAKAYSSMLPGDLRVGKNGELLYHIASSRQTLKRLFENLMRGIKLDSQGMHLQTADKMITDVFCKLSVGTLARTNPMLETVWSFDERKKYASKLVDLFNGKKNYDEMFEDIFGSSPRELPLSAIRKEFESIYQDYQSNKDQEGCPDEQESAGEHLVNKLFMSISRITRETVQAESSLC